MDRNVSKAAGGIGPMRRVITTLRAVRMVRIYGCIAICSPMPGTCTVYGSEGLMSAYAELHALSNFSFLRGASHPSELVAQAHALGYRALALTDECSLAGVVRA